MKQLLKQSSAGLFFSAGALALFLATSISVAPASAGEPTADPNGCLSTAACGAGEEDPEMTYSKEIEDLSGAARDSDAETGRDGDGESSSDSSDNETPA